MPIFIILTLLLLSSCVDTTIEKYEEALVEYEKQKIYFKGNRGEIDSQYKAGKLYCCGDSSKKDPVEALRWYCMAAKNGSSDAMYMVAFIYENASLFSAGSLRQDEVLALTYYKLALDAKNQEAEKNYNKLIEKSTVDKVQQAESLVKMWPKVYCEAK